MPEKIYVVKSVDEWDNSTIIEGIYKTNRTEDYKVSFVGKKLGDFYITFKNSCYFSSAASDPASDTELRIRYIKQTGETGQSKVINFIILHSPK